MGFEPTVPRGITGFQDRLLKPLGHLSMTTIRIITKHFEFVNKNLNIKQNQIIHQTENGGNNWT